MTSKQEVQNRRLLEEIQQQKRQLMMKKQTKPSNTRPSIPQSGSQLPPPPSAQAMNLMKMAEHSCFGYFVPTNSNLGNAIMPVIPRIDPPASEST